MGKLTEWCEGQPKWAHDALYRAATAEDITAKEVDAVAIRVAAAHGIAVEGDHACQSFAEENLRKGDAQWDDVLFCSVGPLEGVDRLANDQELKFALAGVTLVFGDNASGKSGYVRAARQLCHARVAGSLRGDVFADPAKAPPIRAGYCFKHGEAEPVRNTWKPGNPAPPELAGITVLDTENARVYVEKENEILFLPPEITCLTQLGKLYAAGAAKFQADADAIEVAQGDNFGTAYGTDSTAGKLVQNLKLKTSLPDLPSEAEIASAGKWDETLDGELKELELALAQSPAIVAAKYIRANAVLSRVAKQLSENSKAVDDGSLSEAKLEIQSERKTKEAARALAAEQIGGQPIGATGNDAWKRLFEIAREFAAEAGVRAPEQPFEVGDPCPFCQRPLDETSAERLAAFDAFVEGKASADAQVAAKAVADRILKLEALQIYSNDELTENLAEYASLGEEANATADSIIKYNSAVRQRRDQFLEGLRQRSLANVAPLPASPLTALLETVAKLLADGRAILDSAGIDPKLVERAQELRDQKRLHDQLDEVIARRNALDLRARQLTCVAALNTGPVSRLATLIRKDLVTPELSRRIREELNDLGLGHIPLKFSEKTERGASFFEVALETDQRAPKESILSEGEQRALSIACFLADSHVAGRRSAVIFDDPVTSLDHKRLRRVAERLVREAVAGRQIIIFTHNLLFYQEVLRACTDHDPQVPVLPCLIQQASADTFGVVTNDDQPWIAKRVKERERHLEETLKQMPDDLAEGSEELRKSATSFYTDLRETWERAVEEIVLNAVIERFGTDVKTQSLKGVEVTDEDYRIIFNAMKRASEYSGHDRAAGRQLDPPSKDQMRKDLDELRAFRATRQKRRNELQEERKKLEEAPRADAI
jgi:energy-coupling factor transporter ATP-binding protein EcfA2